VGDESARVSAAARSRGREPVLRQAQAGERCRHQAPGT